MFDFNLAVSVSQLEVGLDQLLFEEQNLFAQLGDLEVLLAL